MEKCNGWANYFTWCAALWFSEWGFSAASFDALNAYDLSIELMEFIEEEAQNVTKGNAGMMSDFLSGAINLVDWYEIAENMLAD